MINKVIGVYVLCAVVAGSASAAVASNEEFAQPATVQENSASLTDREFRPRSPGWWLVSDDGYYRRQEQLKRENDQYNSRQLELRRQDNEYYSRQLELGRQERKRQEESYDREKRSALDAIESPSPGSTGPSYASIVEKLLAMVERQRAALKESDTRERKLLEAFNEAIKIAEDSVKLGKISDQYYNHCDRRLSSLVKDWKEEVKLKPGTKYPKESADGKDLDWGYEVESCSSSSERSCTLRKVPTNK